MRCLVERVEAATSPESLTERLRGQPGLVLLRSSLSNVVQGRYSFVTARPFLTFRSSGSRCELLWPGGSDTQFGNPWRILDGLMPRYELADEFDLPFPLGGCFGYWGYELKNFIEPRLSQRAVNDLQLPDCYLGFYDSLVAFDHQLATAWIICTGLARDGSRNPEQAKAQLAFWHERLLDRGSKIVSLDETGLEGAVDPELPATKYYRVEDLQESSASNFRVASNFTRAGFIDRVEQAQAYIRAGDIYQVNLSQRLRAICPWPAWMLFKALGKVSPAPFAAYLQFPGFALASSSPELFLRMSGSHIHTRPIKGTRPRANDPMRDMQLTYQLQTSAKEMAELVMITDLLRNDLGRVCQFGSVQVPELARLERYAQVQHLVATIEGSLRERVSHLEPLAACFPGGSITGAPKIRAMEIIDELEPVVRGPYTGALGYLGFNRESQLAIAIRTVVHTAGVAHFQVGAGIVADSDPEAEYMETLDKARGFIEALNFCSTAHDYLPQRQVRA